MTMVIGRSGKFCAFADVPNATAAAAIITVSNLIFIPLIQSHLELARIASITDIDQTI
jgi:hypothetical protein